jgi:hypothetical protein
MDGTESLSEVLSGPLASLAFLLSFSQKKKEIAFL